jgi:tetratricopeptide (TPR) repeat protein
MNRFVTDAQLLLTALSAVLVAYAQQPDAAELRQHIRAGLDAQQANRLEEAAAEFQTVIRLEPKLGQAYMSLGFIRHDQHNYPEAIPLFEKALDLKPELKNVRAFLGFDYLQTGQLSKAVAQLEKASEEDSTHSEINSWLGMAYLGLGQYRKAIPKLEAALQAQPKNVEILFYLARAYAGVSTQLNDELFNLAPDSPEAHVTLGISHAASGRNDEAVREYKRAAELNPQIPGVHSALGDLYVSASDYESAEKAYGEELQLNPVSAVVNYRYGVVLVQLGRSPEAVPYLQKALASDPALGEAYFHLGRAHFDQGDLTKAEAAWVNALNLKLPLEMQVSLHFQLSQIYRRTDRPAAADKQLEEFKKLQQQLLARDKQGSNK